MSRAAWITFGSSIAFTTTLVYLVHRQQRVEKEAMRAGILREDEEKAKRQRLERNKLDHEEQVKLAQQLALK